MLNYILLHLKLEYSKNTDKSQFNVKPGYNQVIVERQNSIY